MPNFGYEIAGATAVVWQGVVLGQLNAPAGAGTIDSITVYGRESTANGGHTCQAALYLKSTEALQSPQSATVNPFTTTASWQTISFAGPSITAVNYVISCWINETGGDFFVYYDAGDANGHDKYIGNGFAWPNPIVWGNPDRLRDYSAYATYTSNGNEANSSGASTATGVGSSQSTSVANSAASASATASGSASVTSVANAAGTSTATFVGLTTISGAASSIGSGTAASVGSSASTGVANSAGTATVASVGTSSASSVANSQGTATAIAEGSGLSVGASNASSAGTATAIAASASTVSAAFSSSGASAATAVGSSGDVSDDGFFGPYGHAVAKKSKKRIAAQELANRVSQDEDDMKVLTEVLRAAMAEYLKAA